MTELELNIDLNTKWQNLRETVSNLLDDSHIQQTYSAHDVLRIVQKKTHGSFFTKKEHKYLMSLSPEQRSPYFEQRDQAYLYGLEELYPLLSNKALSQLQVMLVVHGNPDKKETFNVKYRVDSAYMYNPNTLMTPNGWSLDLLLKDRIPDLGTMDGNLSVPESLKNVWIYIQSIHDPFGVVGSLAHDPQKFLLCHTPAAINGYALACLSKQGNMMRSLAYTLNFCLLQLFHKKGTAEVHKVKGPWMYKGHLIPDRIPGNCLILQQGGDYEPVSWEQFSFIAS